MCTKMHRKRENMLKKIRKTIADLRKGKSRYMQYYRNAEGDFPVHFLNAEEKELTPLNPKR